MLSLLDGYENFERIAKNHNILSNTLDLSKESFIAPTTLIPLLCFTGRNNITNFKVNNDIEEYVEKILNRRKMSNTVPFVNLKDNGTSREMQSPLEIAEKINYEKYAGLHTIYYVCDELISNINDHTSIEKGYASQGYSYAHEYTNENRLDICVMDDGLSIPGAFEKKGIDFKDDCDAISKATMGVSTAQYEEDDPRYSRGCGLWSSLRLVVEANEGNALIVSRQGCLHITGYGRYKFNLLDNKDIFKGTLIALRFKDNITTHFYDYLELTHNKVEYIYDA